MPFIKLDLCKAYDKVECGFLRAVMAKMDISCKWINVVMWCVLLVSYAILLNGVVF